jgi:hypothetical protein
LGDARQQLKARERRENPRVFVRLDAALEKESSIVNCVVLDVSASGAQLLVELPAHMDLSTLEVEGYGTFPCRVAWQSDTRVGVEFLDDAANSASRLARLLGASLTTAQS